MYSSVEEVGCQWGAREFPGQDVRFFTLVRHLTERGLTGISKALGEVFMCLWRS
jgi:hypothetical protein